MTRETLRWIQIGLLVVLLIVNISFHFESRSRSKEIDRLFQRIRTQNEEINQATERLAAERERLEEAKAGAAAPVVSFPCVRTDVGGDLLDSGAPCAAIVGGLRRHTWFHVPKGGCPKDSVRKEGVFRDFPVLNKVGIAYPACYREDGDGSIDYLKPGETWGVPHPLIH